MSDIHRRHHSNTAMKKIFNVSLIILLMCISVFIIIRNRLENTNDIALNIPIGTSDIFLVDTYTKECSKTVLPKNEFPKNVIGISSVIPLGEKYYVLSQELGATWMRAEFDWRAIEKSDGTYDWIAADDMVSEMNKYGFHLLGNINYLPTNLQTWEDIRSHFQKFTRALAERYGSQGIAYYEIFNEPNLPGWGWLDKKTRPEEYVGEYSILLAIANKEITLLIRTQSWLSAEYPLIP